jgi:hypothetical protein
MTNVPNPGYPQSAPRPSGGGAGKWLLIGGLGCLAVVLLGGCVVGIVLFVVSSRTPTVYSTLSTPDAPSGTTTYTNEESHLNASLRENYVPFSFDYPASWKVVQRGDQTGQSNFVKVEKDDGSGTTIENFAVGTLTGAGSLELDKTLYPGLAESLSRNLAGGMENFAQTGSGAVRVTDHEYEAYQMMFTARSGAGPDSIAIKGRCILISGGNVGRKNGVVLIMLATDKSSARDPSELGESGDLAEILDSFTLSR